VNGGSEAAKAKPKARQTTSSKAKPKASLKTDPNAETTAKTLR
jgi:hypothetical protein